MSSEPANGAPPSPVGHKPFSSALAGSAAARGSTISARWYDDSEEMIVYGRGVLRNG